MLQEIIAYAIIALTAGFVVYSLFFKKNKGCSCGEKCPYCNDSAECQKCPKSNLK